MTNFNYLICELLSEQALHAHERDALVPKEVPHEGRTVKRAFASTLVRLGLRLDPAAGEGLGARSLSLAHREAR